MCGIAGIVGAREPAKTVDGMLGLLRHRGPDAVGLWSTQGVALGHRRLAIVDPSPAGDQPMHDAAGGIVMVANGEIYNAPELRRELQGRGARFTSRSDNEVLLHAYRSAGIPGIARASGMFAVALWDDPRRRLVLARDRLGIKPLYYRLEGGSISFASEIKALLRGRSSWGIDPVGLTQYLEFENCFADRTLYEDVKVLEPGEVLIFEDGRPTRTRYWTPPIGRTDSDLGFEECCSRYLGLVEEAVERHLMSDVPVASYLSAGIDSPTVATLADRRGPTTTYTGAFEEGGWYDEASGAARVARGLSGRHVEVSIGPGDLERDLDHVIEALDEPKMGHGALSQYRVAAAAARDYKVVLTGHGGDEFFSGYSVFKVAALLDDLRSRPARAPARLAAFRPSEWPPALYFLAGRLGSRERRQHLPRLFSRSSIRTALQPGAARRLDEVPPEEGLPFGGRLEERGDPSEQILWIYLRCYLPGLFVVEDRVSMAHGLESRTPLCDDGLVSFALRVPPFVKLHGGELKAIPRAALRAALPELLYRLPKRGFPTPLAAWLRGPSRGFVRRRLLDPESPLRGLVRPGFLVRTLDRYLRSPLRAIRPLDEIQTQRIWMLLSLDAWLRTRRERHGLELRLG